MDSRQICAAGFLEIGGPFCFPARNTREYRSGVYNRGPFFMQIPILSSSGYEILEFLFMSGTFLGFPTIRTKALLRLDWGLPF